MPAGPARGAEPDRPANAPAAYLITFACYGVRLHGNAFGSVDRDHNLPGSRYLSADMPRERAEARAMRQPRYELDRARRELVVAVDPGVMLASRLAAARGSRQADACPCRGDSAAFAREGDASLQGVCLANFESRGCRSCRTTPLEPSRQHAIFVGARSHSIRGGVRSGRARRANGNLAAAPTEPRTLVSGVR